MTEKTVFTNLVYGERVGAADGRTLDIADPVTGEVYATSPLSGPADVDAAVAAASAAFETWRDTTPAQRQLALLKIADAIEARAEEFVAVESADTGKPLAVTASDEIPPCVDQLRFLDRKSVV